MESPRIRVLDAAVIDHIAAGEVVERPASVVKELVENALDAGATAVQVDLEGGGLRGITVTDDGMGMTPAEARLCVLRHATSKLRTSADLFCIKTLGFRGEALSSIASVSHLVITTRPPTARTGFRLEMRGGQVVSEREVGCPRGTSIQVRDLFYNTPARRKFMRAPATEQAHVADAVLRVGMGHRRGGILLMANNRRIVDVPDDVQGHKRIVAALGARVGKLTPLSASQEGVTVEGFVSASDVDRGDTKGLWFFVNGRFVRDRMLQRAVTECNPKIESGRYPTAIIHVDMDPEAVDVNVHPQKLEVRFADATRVYQVLTAALRQAFAPAVSDCEDADDASCEGDDAPAPHVFASTASVWSLASPRRASPARARATVAVAPAASPGTDSTAPPEPTSTFFSRLAVLATVGPYAILGAHDRTYVLNGTAASQACAAAALAAHAPEATVPTHPLLFPMRVEGSREQLQSMSANWESLQAKGFQVEPTGPESFVLKGIPKALKRADPGALLATFLESSTLEACLPLVQAPAEEADIRTLLCDLDRANVVPEQATPWLQLLTPQKLRGLCL